MKCPRCERENEPDATFCVQCGGRLERVCAQCRTANVSDARFCKRCGAALEPAPPPTASLSIDRTAPRSYTPKHLADKILGSRGALEQADPESVIANKLERGVILLGEDLRPILPYLYYLLSIDPGEAVATMDPQQRRGEVFDALRRLLVRASEVRPQVLLHEDLQWIDTASEESLLFD